jgi:hypothetical protein
VVENLLGRATYSGCVELRFARDFGDVPYADPLPER